MSEIKQLPTRDEVPTPLTWDLTKIFKDDAAFDAAYNQLTEELNQAESFKGTLGNGAEAFLAALEYVLDVYRKVETLYVYSHLKMIKTLQIQLTKLYMPELVLYMHKLVKLFLGLTQRF